MRWSLYRVLDFDASPLSDLPWQPLYCVFFRVLSFISIFVGLCDYLRVESPLRRS